MPGPVFQKHHSLACAPPTLRHYSSHFAYENPRSPEQVTGPRSRGWELGQLGLWASATLEGTAAGKPLKAYRPCLPSRNHRRLVGASQEQCESGRAQRARPCSPRACTAALVCAGIRPAAGLGTGLADCSTDGGMGRGIPGLLAACWNPRRQHGLSQPPLLFSWVMASPGTWPTHPDNHMSIF